MTIMTMPASATRFSMLRCAAVLLLLSAVAFAQTGSATLSGTVMDRTGAVVSGAQVRATNSDTNVSSVTTTNHDGIYVIPSLKPGRYRLTVTRQGFKQVVVTDVILNVQDTISRNFNLDPGAVSESVTVTAEGANVNTSDGSVSTVVDRHFVENLPLNGRSFNTLLQLTPGTVMTTLGGRDAGQFTVNGQRVSSNYFSIDGVSANFGTGSGLIMVGNGSGSTQAFNAYGGTSSLVSVDAMQEFRVVTSSFAPEFGRSPGAQVVIGTRSGTNDFHGTIFDYLRNDVLDANDWFAKAAGLPRPKERQNDFGGVFGGPILRDKTFFFLSYEGLRLRLPQTAVIHVPSEALRASAIPAAAEFLNGFPQPNGPAFPDGVSAQFTGGFSNSITMNAISARIDHSIGSKVHLFGRFNHAPSSNLSRVAGLSQLSNSHVDTDTSTAGLDLQFSPHTTDSLRTNFSVQHGRTLSFLDNFGGAQPPPVSDLFPTPLDPGKGFVSFNIIQLSQTLYSSGAQGDNRTTQINLVDDVTHVVGRHQLKFGGDFRRVRLSTGGFNPGLSHLVFSLADFAATATPGLTINEVNSPTKVRFHGFSLYAQDTWTAMPRLTLTYGVRWEIAPAPVGLDGTILASWLNVSDPANTVLAPAGTPAWHTRYSNFAPRIGAAYQLTSKGDLVVRAGFGVFFDQGTSTIPLLIDAFPNSQLVFAGGQTLPLTSAGAITPPPVSLAPPYPVVVEGFSPDLEMPRSYQWNLALEKSFGKQILTATYLGQAGRRLLREEFELAPNANFSFLFDVTGNRDTSDYDALQLQFRRPLARGLQVLANYTWSHSFDSSSLDAAGDLPSSSVISPQSTRGSSDFDVRHNFSAAVSYDLPSPRGGGLLARLGSNWGIDSVVEARTALPVNVVTISPAVEGGVPTVQPDLVQGQPIWIADSSVGGGRRLNPAAFAVPGSGEGNLPRNSIRGFGFSQMDFSVRRDFHFTERWSLRSRVDFFNLLNHPNFADPSFPASIGGALTTDRSTQMLNQGLGGLSPIYQIGGPRSVQISLKVTF